MHSAPTRGESPPYPFTTKTPLEGKAIGATGGDGGDGGGGGEGGGGDGGGGGGVGGDGEGCGGGLGQASLLHTYISS
tara:strand:- start:711 stop:941 length:231 start_codon:yes stop_codon:yes gene_type:complete